MASSIEDFLADYIDRPTLARSLGVSTRTIARYENQPDGLPSTMIGGRKLYRGQSVIEWLKEQEVHPNPRRRR